MIISTLVEFSYVSEEDIHILTSEKAIVNSLFFEKQNFLYDVTN